jgi:pilus assembly protein CpaC
MWNSKMPKKSWSVLAFAALVLAFFQLPSAVIAGPAEVLSVEIGKSRILRLEGEPSVVSIGDPTIADVVIEEDNVIFLIGQAYGETNIYILDGKGKALLSADVVVEPKSARQVTLNRGTDEYVMSCNPRCVQVSAPVQQVQAGAAGDTTLGTLLPTGAPGAPAQPSAGATGGAGAAGGLGKNLGGLMQQMMQGALGGAASGIK